MKMIKMSYKDNEELNETLEGNRDSSMRYLKIEVFLYLINSSLLQY